MPDSHFNAVKHGCTARSPVLPGEDESLWQEVEADWFIDYEPQTNTSRTLVSEAALAFWHMVRTRRQFEHVNRHLALQDPLAWTDDDHTLYTRFNRYKTAAERAFSNAFKNVEYLRKARTTEAEAQRRLQHQIDTLHFQMERDGAKQNLAEARFVFERQKHADAQAKQAAAPASSNTKKKQQDSFEVTEQWMEITVTDGVTQTEYVPTNEELLEELRKTQLVPKLIYRRMYFPDGVPPEYAWTNLHDITTCELNRAGQWCEPCARYLHGGAGLQRMTFDTWKETIIREALTPGRHAGPTGAGNLHRPKERGGDHDYAELLHLAAQQKQHNRQRDVLLDDAPEDEPSNGDHEKPGNDNSSVR